MAERYDDRWGRERDGRGDREMFGSREQPRYFGTGSYAEGGTGFGGGYGDRYGDRFEEERWSSERGPYRGALGYRDWWREPFGPREHDPPYRSTGHDRSFSGGYDDGRVSTYRPDIERRYARGPKGYERSDERIREDLSDRLMYRDDIDSSDVSVTVVSGKVRLEGTVPERRMKHAIEDLAEACAGVSDVDNGIRVRRAST